MSKLGVPSRLTRLLAHCALALAFWLGLAPEAGAQDVAPEHEAPSAEAKKAPAAPGLSEIYLPEPVHEAVAEYPEEALRQGIEGHVVLRLDIDVDGNVTEAEVMAPAGHGFDEAARAAAMHSKYRPARKGDTAVASRILVRIDFRLPPPPATGSISGRIASPAPERQAAVASEPVPAALQPIEVSVRGYSEAERLRRSAEAVHVVETAEAKRQSQDLGEVLSRTQGVAVQRSSGLGSDTRISLNGLTDDQIRVFSDGIPLHFMGYPFGIANVPVNLVERIEIYRGVVPVRFGADALGGAINLVSDQGLDAGVHGAASFQEGSFGTYRATVSGHHLHEPGGWLTRVGAFLDRAQNDYPMEIVVPNEAGREVPARVYRFHDAYRARGANIEAGVVNRSWAKRLSLRGFITDHDKQVQHNLFMTFNPYADVEYGQTTSGAVARYDNVPMKQLALSAVAGYAYEHTWYSDIGECIYDWFGQCIRDRVQPGERIGRAQDQDYWEHNVYGRLNLEWLLHPAHSLHVSVSPTYSERSGTEYRLANPDARDPLSAERRLGGVVTGIEYETRLLARELENRLFFKDYVVDENDDIYFSGHVWTPGLTLTSDYPSSCALRIRAGEDDFDDEWQLNFAEDITDGREAATLRYLGDGKALLDVFHHERAKIGDGTDSYELVASANWRLWLIDIEDSSGEPIEAIDFKGAGLTDIQVGDRTFLMLPNEDWSETTAWELVNGEASKGFKVQGNSYQTLRVR